MESSQSFIPTIMVSPINFESNLALNIIISVFLALCILDNILFWGQYVVIFGHIICSQRKKPSQLVFSGSVISVFVLLRLLTLPILMVLVPLPSVNKLVPLWSIRVGFYIIMTFSAIRFILLNVACVYSICKFGFRGNKLGKLIVDKSTGEIPRAVIIMPIYNEAPEALIRAVLSGVRSDYLRDKLHIILAFDDKVASPLYYNLLRGLNYKSDHPSLEEDAKLMGERLDFECEGVLVTVGRFEHGGKSATQGKAFQIANELYGANPHSTNSTNILYIDSDIILDRNAIHNFVYTMRDNPNLKAVTGFISCRTSAQFNLYTYLQDAEYLGGQLFNRSLDYALGSVTCLPGALTMIRLESMQRMAPQYFRKFDMGSCIDFHRYYLGEDRYLTHLLMEENGFSHSRTLGICGAARCKTEAPDSLMKLIKQRRRWHLGSLPNELNMLCSIPIWSSVPMLAAFRLFAFSMEGMDWLLPVYLIWVGQGLVPLWMSLVIICTLVVRYLLISLYAGIMGRIKIILFFPVLLLLLPLFQTLYFIYSIATFNVRSWGGPRTDTENVRHSK